LRSICTFWSFIFAEIWGKNSQFSLFIIVKIRSYQQYQEYKQNILFFSVNMFLKAYLSSTVYKIMRFFKLHSQYMLSYQSKVMIDEEYCIFDEEIDIIEGDDKSS